jgi:pimeloyl-ACP methyl ester carboxylesterase
MGCFSGARARCPKLRLHSPPRQGGCRPHGDRNAIRCVEDREPIAGPEVAPAQVAAFRAWERIDGERFGKLRRTTQPCLVVNGVLDMMIPVRNSYLLAGHLPNDAVDLSRRRPWLALPVP